MLSTYGDEVVLPCGVGGVIGRPPLDAHPHLRVQLTEAALAGRTVGTDSKQTNVSIRNATICISSTRERERERESDRERERE